MKELFIEYGYVSLNKYGEELCGDNVEWVTVDGYTTLVLADGLGSGSFPLCPRRYSVRWSPTTSPSRTASRP